MEQEKKSRGGRDYERSMEALGQMADSLPDFESSYDRQIKDIYERILNRESFRYEPNSDPMYSAYRDRYVNEGRLAMRDSMGQAAALTGGYASSYAQSVGQQQFESYLERLGNVMPQLYSAAFSRYKAEGDGLTQLYRMAEDGAQREYGRYKDALAAAAQDRSLDNQERRLDYEIKSGEFKSLMELITKIGYTPTAEELERSGMSPAQAEALRQKYLKDNNLLRPASPPQEPDYYGGGKGDKTPNNGRERRY